MSRMQEENKIQGHAIRILNPSGAPWRDLCICEAYASEWRQIIIDYTEQHGRTPTHDDLIWITSEHIGKDLREAVKEAFPNV